MAPLLPSVANSWETVIATLREQDLHQRLLRSWRDPVEGESLSRRREDAVGDESIPYCAASGQLVSVEKSSVFFSASTDVNVKAEVCSTLNIMTEALNDKYLGLPATLGLDKSDSFQYLIDRLIQRLMGWKEKCLSFGGKEVLLKSVAQAIPTYAMSVFKIPKKVCKGIMDAMSSFWWGDDATQKKMHWSGG
nr:uncharacterized protein LOC109770742 [Aegilops tauschii subsp. strangulata]